MMILNLKDGKKMTKSEYLGYKRFYEELKRMADSLLKTKGALKPKILVRDGMLMKSLQDLRDWMDTGCVDPKRYYSAVDKFEQNNEWYLNEITSIDNCIKLINNELLNCKMFIDEYEFEYINKL